MAHPEFEKPKLTFIQSIQRNFLTGLFLLLPLIVSIYILIWLYVTITGPTVQLLKQVYPELQGKRWVIGMSVFAFVLNISIVLLVGVFTRYVIGRKVFQLLEALLGQVPILNRVYGGAKQIIEGFSPDKKAVFEQVVLVEFPRAGSYSIGFVTGRDSPLLSGGMGGSSATVFVPTTPNPTSGFLLVVRTEQMRVLDLSVADAIKLVISGGAVKPAQAAERL